MTNVGDFVCVSYMKVSPFPRKSGGFKAGPKWDLWNLIVIYFIKDICGQGKSNTMVPCTIHCNPIQNGRLSKLDKST